jgi:sugar phosphate isomerase/epimerase
MLRRTFVQSSLLPLFASAAPAGVRLGYDTYSIRNYKWKAMQHLDYAASLKLDAIQLSSLDDFESLEPAHLAKIKDRARELNIALDAGTGCVCPSSTAYSPKNGDPAEYLSKAIRVAHAIGSTSVRCFLGAPQDRTANGGIEKHIENTVQVFRKCKTLCETTGVKIALENHSDMQAWELRTLLDEAGKTYSGACLDTGNPMMVIEDPVVTMEVLGPYTLTTHFRDTAIFEHPSGAAVQWVAMGDGCVDHARVLQIKEQLCPAASVHLEIITGRRPTVIPFREESFWKAYPKAKASEFVRFLDLAKKNCALTAPMMVTGPLANAPEEYKAALSLQQKLDLEKSIAYMKKTLGVGLAWKG